jgi:hypothetical protein
MAEREGFETEKQSIVLKRLNSHEVSIIPKIVPKFFCVWPLLYGLSSFELAPKFTWGRLCE